MAFQGVRVQGILKKYLSWDPQGETEEENSLETGSMDAFCGWRWPKPHITQVQVQLLNHQD